MLVWSEDKTQVVWKATRQNRTHKVSFCGHKSLCMATMWCLCALSLIVDALILLGHTLLLLLLLFQCVPMVGWLWHCFQVPFLLIAILHYRLHYTTVESLFSALCVRLTCSRFGFNSTHFKAIVILPKNSKMYNIFFVILLSVVDTFKFLMVACNIIKWCIYI